MASDLLLGFILGVAAVVGPQVFLHVRQLRMRIYELETQVGIPSEPTKPEAT